MANGNLTCVGAEILVPPRVGGGERDPCKT